MLVSDAICSAPASAQLSPPDGERMASTGFGPDRHFLIKAKPSDVQDILDLYCEVVPVS
jgi:hypothetical protein